MALYFLIVMKKIGIVLIFIYLLSFQFCFGDDFRYLRTNEGLYNGEINSIAQDKAGKMWFATWTGLTCYNGYNFQYFKPELGNPLSLADKKINKIFIDSKDVLWISSNTGVSFFRKEDQTFHSINVGGLSPSYFYVSGFFESNGHVLIYTTSGIFLVYNSSDSGQNYRTKKLKIFAGKTEFVDFIHTMSTFQDHLALISDAYSNMPTRLLLGDLLVDTRDTLIRIQNPISYPKHINAITYLKEENKLYLGTNDGISVLRPDQKLISDPIYFKGMVIQNLLYTSNHKIYCYSGEPVLYYADTKSGQTGQYLPDPLKLGSLLDNIITCLFEDFSGNLWVGHQGLGLSILNLNRKAFYSFKHDPSIPNSLNGNIVMCFNGTDKEIFIGMRQGGLNVTSKKPDKLGNSEFRVLSYQQQAKPLSQFDNIWDIARESDSVFWVASNGGIDRLRKTNQGWIYGTKSEQPLYRGVVRKIMIDNKKNIWCGTFSNGLVFIPALSKNPDKKTFNFPYNFENKEGVSGKTVLSMIIDSKDRFWVGTINGLDLLKTKYSQLDLSGKTNPDVRFTQFIATKPEKHFLNANEINCIYENTDGKIWLATQGGGVNIMDPDSVKFTHLTASNGLLGDDVLGILPDRSGIKWISSNKGLVTFNAANPNKPLTYYGISDGLQGESFKVNSYYQSADGEMFFGGDNGFTRFYPDQISHNLIAPKIGLTNLKILNKIVNIGDTISKGNLMSRSLDEMDELELQFQNNTFSIGVGVHHYQYPEGNLIRYKLDGFIDRWITVPASNQNIYFSKLPAGTYTLHISAVSADNIEAESERLLEIKILPPWYKSWYARGIFMVLLGSLISYLFFWLDQQQKISFKKKIDDISFENNVNKMRFLTNIAHELRTPLSLVIAPVEDMKQNYTSIEPKWKEHLNLIFRNSNYLLTLINQIIDFSKLNEGKLQLSLQTADIVSLVREVYSNFKGLESRRKSNLQIDVPDQVILVDIDRQKIEEVLYNLLSNAFKHTDENHVIKVSLKLIHRDKSEDRKERVQITVFNEGKDISDEDKEKIFERFYKVNENVEGAGIGLSFSRSLIEMHNGTISVESVAGIGVAFHVILPFAQYQIVEATAVQSNTGFLWHEDGYNSEQVHELENKGKALTLVIVEDNIDLRSFLSNTLSGIYNCYEAGDGQEGYELISRIIPDIVISDVVMPKMDGYELCEKIKDNTKTCHIPVILLTANNAADHIVSGYEKGADAYVTKPFDMSIVKAQISRLIKNRDLIREKYMTQNFMVEISQSNLSKDDEFIVKLRQLLEDNLSESDFNVKKLSEDLNISTTHLYRKLKALTGLSPVEFIRVFKLQKACEMLSNTNLSIKEIGYGLGFNNLSYFVKCFREQFGVTPTTFRVKGMPESSKNNSTNQSGVS